MFNSTLLNHQNSSTTTKYLLDNNVCLDNVESCSSRYFQGKYISGFDTLVLVEGVPLFSEVKTINRMSETNVPRNLADFVNANFRKASELQLLKQHTKVLVNNQAGLYDTSFLLAMREQQAITITIQGTDKKYYPVEIVN